MFVPPILIENLENFNIPFSQLPVDFSAFQKIQEFLKVIHDKIYTYLLSMRQIILLPLSLLF